MNNNFLAQNMKTGEFIKSSTDNNIVLTTDLDKAFRFNLLEGTRFLEIYNEEYILKSESRILRELNDEI